ncbi:hypothetical protein [Allonocardiopsis opalescens]|uniref:YtxH domain-containing protein n=1 Tax=Allonocardiopsis opalescens TaxID=1144618 RepID=A0A2T0QFW0_9ACTN|nr:hypothetical protein [Allonocardiopsis opalescens]PRY02731.1 hypothetical protein CLV72_1011334 [Allonocardiopsis opalescens]
MGYRLAFVAGLAIGYVLGSRAGRERYDQIARAVRGVGESPAFQEVVGLVEAQVENGWRTVRRTVADRLPADPFSPSTEADPSLSRPSPEPAPGSVPEQAPPEAGRG